MNFLQILTLLTIFLAKSKIFGKTDGEEENSEASRSDMSLAGQLPIVNILSKQPMAKHPDEILKDISNSINDNNNNNNDNKNNNNNNNNNYNNDNNNNNNNNNDNNDNINNDKFSLWTKIAFNKKCYGNMCYSYSLSTVPVENLKDALDKCPPETWLLTILNYRIQKSVEKLMRQDYDFKENVILSMLYVGEWDQWIVNDDITILLSYENWLRGFKLLNDVRCSAIWIEVSDGTISYENSIYKSGVESLENCKLLCELSGASCIASNVAATDTAAAAAIVADDVTVLGDEDEGNDRPDELLIRFKRSNETAVTEGIVEIVPAGGIHNDDMEKKSSLEGLMILNIIIGCAYAAVLIAYKVLLFLYGRWFTIASKKIWNLGLMLVELEIGLWK
ncbi:hypothetical protein HELRODRAFT_193072 [Helobdella robusta]|uniref:C-type lectin domain-containing protein n=1 Tax=Helobdella robusta TaxID=6412 RepID=T1FUL5_HELRO|nr:hypothetical protein HELRODRAFT_193072 [Helobdella robusta]ESN98058.1 hypothetical protein HELRODRAFT_193072 [Helobdella robusta]